MTLHERAAYMRQYFEYLTASEYTSIIAMFEDDGIVDSPYLGKLPASEFFSKLGNASSQNILTVHDVLFGENGDSAAAHFEYDWTLEGGDQIVFQGVDYFKFSESGKFASMSIFYDTHPTRQDVGDKYGTA
ncbi:MAG: nuclear transport factor 2 family protein [Boseongicola sp. SB0664_bin_43]|uniref:Nuclear transport factor 2 family protein n=1 Tax=Boseongicola sp. SB0664_bin_43 TaxID=2604844 RepID=A0A6B0Y4T6_9RHOB|nr:nuclear transport factor 2 family protein [Boseongicola sp. SB0664_bin_43]